MGGFQNAKNNKPQTKMQPAQAAYKRAPFALETDATLGKRNAADAATVNRAEREWVNSLKQTKLMSNRSINCNCSYLHDR